MRLNLNNCFYFFNLNFNLNFSRSVETLKKKSKNVLVAMVNPAFSGGGGATQTASNKRQVISKRFVNR